MSEHPAIANLRTNQRQLDMDGCEVGVSRQAVEESLEEIDRLRAVAIAARDLIENIREHGVHDNWKRTANALREVTLPAITA